MNRSIFRTCQIAVLVLLLGCIPPDTNDAGPVSEKRHEANEPVANSEKDNPELSKTGIFGKTTQDIGEFDPNAGEKVSDSQIDPDRIGVPVIGAIAAYGPLMEQVSKLGVTYAIRMFEASEGRYPKNHDEFMERIIKANQIQLPVLPAGAQYQYDVENHELKIIEAKKEKN